MSSERDQFIQQMGVPYETALKLDRYAELLGEWNQKFNLVAASTLPHIWNRHFLDSAQLLKYIPEGAVTLADMGSGAGFPGLVLSILGVPQVHLIDGTGKKANFLRAVAEDLKLNTVVHQARVEELRLMRFDVITARALSSLPELLKLANRISHNETVCLFLKGQSAEVELTDSSKYWTFSCKKRKSISDPSGNVLILKDLKFKNAATQKRRHK